MSNDLTNVIPKIIAQALLVARGNLVMPRLVSTDYGSAARQKGSVIDVPIAPEIAVTDVVPSENQTAAADVTPGLVQIPLDQWKEARFKMDDDDILQAESGTTPMCIISAATAIVSTINEFLLGLYLGVYSYGGTAGTTPFTGSPATSTDVTQARKRLNEMKAPAAMRRFVLDPAAGALALDLGIFQKANESADRMIVTEGVIGRKFGFDFYEDQQVPTHTAGTITTGLIAKASTAQAIGLKAIVCTTAASTGAVALKKGDIMLFAGDTQTYVLTADATEASAATDVTLNIEPALKVALSGSEAVTVKATHVVNLAFQRGAFAFASRPLSDIRGITGLMSKSMTDPVSGLSMRLEVTRQNKQTMWSLDALYGGGLVDPSLVTRVAG